MRIRSFLVVAIAAAGMVLAVGGPALADSTASVTGASVRFKSLGEHFVVCDTRADGKAAMAVYSLTATGESQTWLENHNGNGTCKDFNLSFAEGQAVYYTACLRDGENIGPCSAERRDRA